MYFVFDSNRGFLALSGPFMYPSWVQAAGEATPLSWFKAHAFAFAYGGDVVGTP